MSPESEIGHWLRSGCGNVNSRNMGGRRRSPSGGNGRIDFPIPWLLQSGKGGLLCGYHSRGGHTCKLIMLHKFLGHTRQLIMLHKFLDLRWPDVEQ